jgi:hypothetical protein
MNAAMEAKTSPKVKIWVWQVVEASDVFRPANGKEDGRWAQGADEHGGTEQGGMGQNGGMARRLLPFAIFSSAIPSCTLFNIPA